MTFVEILEPGDPQTEECLNLVQYMILLTTTSDLVQFPTFTKTYKHNNNEKTTMWKYE